MLAKDLESWFAECTLAYIARPCRRWTHRRKCQAIELMLRSDPHRSDRSLSRETGFSREFIAGHRVRLLSRGQIPEGHRVGMDGKNYTMAIKS